MEAGDDFIYDNHRDAKKALEAAQATFDAAVAHKDIVLKIQVRELWEQLLSAQEREKKMQMAHAAAMAKLDSLFAEEAEAVKAAEEAGKAVEEANKAAVAADAVLKHAKQPFMDLLDSHEIVKKTVDDQEPEDGNEWHSVMKPVDLTKVEDETSPFRELAEQKAQAEALKAELLASLPDLEEAVAAAADELQIATKSHYELAESLAGDGVNEAKAGLEAAQADVEAKRKAHYAAVAAIPELEQALEKLLAQRWDLQKVHIDNEIKLEEFDREIEKLNDEIEEEKRYAVYF